MSPGATGTRFGASVIDWTIISAAFYAAVTLWAGPPPVRVRAPAPGSAAPAPESGPPIAGGLGLSEEPIDDEYGEGAEPSVSLLFIAEALALVFAAPYTLFAPLLYFGFFTGLTGTTPGKFLLRLKVVDRMGCRPGLLRALARETLRLLAMNTVLPALLAAWQIGQGQKPWYDRLCRTNVAQLPPLVKRTRTQREFLKHYRDVR